MLVFMFITIVVLLNILIAQISDTYKTIQTDAKKSMLVNRSWTIARLERNALLFPNKNQNCLRNLRERLKKLLPSYKTGPQEGVARSHQEEGQNKCERFLSEADLKTLPSNETEEIRSTLTRIEKQLWKTDQNLKARVRTQTIEVKHINYTLQEIKEMLKPSHSR
ncbi:uncharacterized protein LOC123562138 [Mercenaria mercenaria]|uniref:uncharacterized protein LOC123562138 n=1 Tax=Mercenaria mercenaria TaxID=6596 RepID=UPI00234E7270|nr:uncharacterized protein LOC123562138 [Mercenaria mercenaria]